MIKYIIDKDKTLDLHYTLQEKMFEHCADLEEDSTYNAAYCKECPHFLACKISNEISFRISMNRW